MEKVVDARLQQETVVDEITRVVQIGLLCTQANPDERPAMSRVVELLRDRDGARGDAEFVLGDPPFFEVEIDIGGGVDGEACTLLPQKV